MTCVRQHENYWPKVVHSFRVRSNDFPCSDITSLRGWVGLALCKKQALHENHCGAENDGSDLQLDSKA